MTNSNAERLASGMGDVVDEYDREHHAEVVAEYEELFAALRELHRRHPHWRFGQMIVNLAAMSGTTRPGEPYDVPDERLVKAARDLLSKRPAMADDSLDRNLIPR